MKVGDIVLTPYGYTGTITETRPFKDRDFSTTMYRVETPLPVVWWREDQLEIAEPLTDEQVEDLSALWRWKEACLSELTRERQEIETIYERKLKVIKDNHRASKKD